MRLNMSTEFFYNDGYGGREVEHDWSHANFSLSTKLDFGHFYVTPKYTFQKSMEDTVNKSDEHIFLVGTRLTF